MALTKAAWLTRLRKWVPAWVFEKENVNVAVFTSVARILSEIQGQTEEYLDATFLDEMTGALLDLAGYERGIYRLAGEQDDPFRERIRLIANSTNYTALLALINDQLNNGTATIIENWMYGFDGDDFFADVDLALSGASQYNRFTVIIPLQEIEDDTNLKAAIIKVIDDNKAEGVFYDLIYYTLDLMLTEGGEFLLTEGGDIITGET